MASLIRNLDVTTPPSSLFYRPLKGAGVLPVSVFDTAEFSFSIMTPRSPTARALAALDVLNRIVKRAQHGVFAFDIEGKNVRVRNESYGDPSAHQYTVTVEDGVPRSCTCPADAHYESARKHRVAVAIRKPVLTAATRALTDGRTTTEETSDTIED